MSKLNSNFIVSLLALQAVMNDKIRQRSTRLSAKSSDDQTLPEVVEDRKTDDHRSFVCLDAQWKLQPTIKLFTAYIAGSYIMFIKYIVLYFICSVPFWSASENSASAFSKIQSSYSLYSIYILKHLYNLINKSEF